MIQEILDCLLIKAHFILLTEDELLAKVQEEEKLTIYCAGICKLLEQDMFLYTNPEFIKKIEAIIRNKRFEGRHSNELIIDFNTMVDAVLKYKRLTEEEKESIIFHWLYQEAELRKLSFRNLILPSQVFIYQCITFDSYYATLLLQNNQYIIENPFYLLNTINMLTTVYPIVFTPLDQDTEEEKQAKLEGILKCYACTDILKQEIKSYKMLSFEKYVLKKYLKTTRMNIEKVMECANIKLEEESVQFKKTKN